MMDKKLEEQLFELSKNQELGDAIMLEHLKLIYRRLNKLEAMHDHNIDHHEIEGGDSE